MSVGIEEVREYYNSRLDKAAKQEGSTRHQRITQALRKFVGKPGMSILDLGCGIGISSETMARMGAYVVAVDIADELLKYAEDSHYHPNVQYLNADVTKLRLGRKYDAITIIDALEHLRPEDLSDFFDVLQVHSHPETLIYLNIPHYKFLLFLKDNYPDVPQIIDEAYTPGEVTQAFGDIGFYPYYMQMYGLGSIAQYIDYMFIGEENLNRQYQEFYTA
ncbi:MAG: class I SAM-dependent methyltransferase [Candidatus Thorarchaeota archaeon]|jgi:cyclopropane fatty-acyl-phospholipid synthase-like methyltransferase